MGFGASDSFCNTGLGLGLSLHIEKQHHPQQKKRVLPLKFDDEYHSFPSLTLGLPDDQTTMHRSAIRNNMEAAAAEDDHPRPKASDSISVSSFTNSISVQKERGLGNYCDDEVEVGRVPSRISEEEEEEGGSPRKKLRLTKQQSALLEDHFKEHTNLNPKQKQALAEQLNLRPRQVEVWFQNRRARTKLKQTEVDYEFLKKCCETLTEENKRLQKELQELKSLKLAAPLYTQLPAATLAMCPSCERVCSGGGVHGGASTGGFAVRPVTENYVRG